MVLEHRQCVSSCVADLLHACHTRESEWPVKVPANWTKLEHRWLLLILCVSCWLWERNLCTHEYVCIYRDDICMHWDAPPPNNSGHEESYIYSRGSL